MKVRDKAEKARIAEMCASDDTEQAQFAETRAKREAEKVREEANKAVDRTEKARDEAKYKRHMCLETDEPFYTQTLITLFVWNAW